MSALTFDTLKFARRLKAAGMDARLAEEQAEAMAEVLQTHLDGLATKSDIAELRKDMQLMEQRLVIKLGSMLVVAVGVVAALVKLL